MPAQGTAVLNFGNGATDTSVFVANTSITSSMLLEAWVFPQSTSTNTVDNHWVEDLKIVAGNIVNGVGFTIYGSCRSGLAHGEYTVGYVFN